MFIDYGISKDCKNLMESYGHICVKCGKCGRKFKDGMLNDGDDKVVIEAYKKFRKKRALKKDTSKQLEFPL